MSSQIDAFMDLVEEDPSHTENTWKILKHYIDTICNHKASALCLEDLYRNALIMVLQNYGEIRHSVKNKRWKFYPALRIIIEKVKPMLKDHIPETHEFELNSCCGDEINHSNNIHMKLKNTLVEIFHREREVEVNKINMVLLRKIVKLLIVQGPSVYQEFFEKPFLDIATNYYRNKSEQLIQSCDYGDYLKKIEICLNKEKERVSHYLGMTSRRKITYVVEKEMIECQMTILVNSGLVNMIMDDKHDDLKRMYNLLCRVPNGKKLIRDRMTWHFQETVHLVTDTERLKNLVDFVWRLFEVINLSFNNDNAFLNPLNSLLEDFIKLNPQAPEFILLFVDDKLREEGLEREILLDKLMRLFRYLPDKGGFEMLYRKHLVERFVSGKTGPEGAERSFITKLKAECGDQYTSKLEGMLTDMETSQATMQGFYDDARGRELDNGPTLDVHAVSTKYWLPQSSTSCNLPSEIISLCDTFRAYYNRTHIGRKLTWQTNMGSAVMTATFGGQKYELQVPTYHMCVLMLFNDADRLSYKEIKQAVEIPTMDLKRCLQSLVNCADKNKNVLRKEPMGTGVDISEEDVFFVNEKFSNKLKIDTLKESETEQQEAGQKLEEAKKPHIEAAIVRVMKARQVLDHKMLVEYVIETLQSRFRTDPRAIKSRIEALIEREFLERDTQDANKYRYLS